MSVSSRCLLLLTFVPVLTAQSFIVDVNGGPGTHFTSLVQAAALAPDGSTLLVRAGNYPGVVTIASKGLTILADPGVQIVQGGIDLQTTQATQPCLVRGIYIPAGFSTSYGHVRILGCLGRVVLEQVHPAPSPIGGSPTGLTVSGSSFVVARQCIVFGGAAVTSSLLVAEGCSFWGRDASVPGAFSGWSATPALTVGNGGVVQLTLCNLQGGDGDCPMACAFGAPMPPHENKPALELLGGTVTARAGGTLIGGNRIVQGEAITGAGGVRLSPSTSVVGAITSSPPVQVVAMPDVRSASATIGASITASANGTQGHVLFLVVGWPAPSFFLPGVQDAFWIEPVGHYWASVGTTSPLLASVVVPPLPALFGIEVAWQAVEFSPGNGFVVTPPSISVVH